MNKNTAYTYINYYYNMMRNSNSALSESTKNELYNKYLKYGTNPNRLSSRDNFIYEMMAARCGANSVLNNESYTEIYNKIGPMWFPKET